MPAKGVDRKLKAILAADVVAFSRLIGADEEGTLDRLNSLRHELLDPTVATHHGRVFKYTGDGFLAEFASAVDAVRCALEIQSGMAQSGSGTDNQGRIDFRIGINVGDVVEQDGDIFGDGVNIAARLEAIAEPGGVIVSHTVHDHAQGKQSFRFDELGERSLKNIERPVRVFRASWGDTVRLDGPTELVSGGPSPPLPEKPSIAVLPFDNLSNQAGETYFSDGITEDIITGLARFRSFLVVARNSSFAFRGKPIDLAEIGRRLGVSYLLEGSVRRAGDRVRITAQLVEAASGMHIWAERYDRGIEDIFAVQDDVAQMIASALSGRIQEAGVQRSARLPTRSLSAYDCVLRGIGYFRGYATDDNQRALEMFERAVALDPQYAIPHAYLALVSVTMHGSADAPLEVLHAAVAKVTRAIELDPEDSRCYRSASTIWLYCREFEMAEHNAKRSLDLNPNDADCLMQRGRVLALRGYPEEALVWLERAVRLNPLHPPWYHAHFGIALYSLRRFSEAAQAFKKMPVPGPWSLGRLAACYAQLDRTAEAQVVTEYALKLREDFSIADYMRREVLLEREEDRELLREGLIKAGLPQ